VWIMTAFRVACPSNIALAAPTFAPILRNLSNFWGGVGTYYERGEDSHSRGNLMSGIFMAMARQAQHDERLVASHIRTCAGRRGTDWTGVAQELAITLEQLSKLALCRVPRQDHYADDVDCIAEYVGMEPATLAWFLEDAVSPSRQRMQIVSKDGDSARQRVRASRASLNLKRLSLAAASLALAAFLGAFVLTETREVSTATLVVNEGETTLISENRILLLFTRQNEMQIAPGGTIAVSTGDAIDVPQGGSATLRLSDGSLVDLDGGTVIEVAELVTTDQDYRVRLDMLTGRTVSRVQRVLGAGDAFEVSTPSSSASVRGTVFTVQVIDDETTYVAVSEGTVWFEMDGETIELHEGDEITAHRGQPLSTETPAEERTPPTADPATVEPTDEPDQPPTPTPVPMEAPAVAPEQTLTPAVLDNTQAPTEDPTIEPAAIEPSDEPDDSDNPNNPPDPPADPAADPPIDPPGNPPVDLDDGDGPPPGHQVDTGDNNSNNSGGNPNK
jgi:ferric-dicitrate binding protein FerR (iron transport regulator)